MDGEELMDEILILDDGDTSRQRVVFDKRREKATNSPADALRDPTGVVDAAECTAGNGGELKKMGIDKLESFSMK